MQSYPPAPSPQRTRLKKLWQKLWPPLAGLAAILFAWLITLTPPWREFALKEFDLWTVSSPAPTSKLPIFLIAIDDSSIAALNQRWPWPRRLHAKLIDELKAAGVGVIAFDVTFDTPSSEADDAALEAAIRRAGNVVLALGEIKEETQYGYTTLLKRPLIRFRKAGATEGRVNIYFDADRVVRIAPTEDNAFWRAILDMGAKRVPDFPGYHPLPSNPRLRYLGEPGVIPRVSYYQALDLKRNLPAAIPELQDAIVIIGRTAASTAELSMAKTDTFATPYSSLGNGAHTPGPEIHATLIENAVRGLTIQTAPDDSRSGLMLSVAFLALLIMGRGRFRPLTYAGMVILSSVGLLTLGYCLFVFAAYWLPVADALLPLPIVYASQAVVGYVGERRQREEIRRTFSRYVPEAVANELAIHPEKLVLGGERREVTLMFTDLEGFTSMSESAAPETVAEVLNRHFTAMHEIVIRYGGTVDKFIGDAIMAFWGAPLTDPEHALHATQAAIEMQAEMERLRAAFAAEGLPEIKMRVGLHTGQALIGNLGSRIGRVNYTAVGDAVNLASRLEGMNKEYGTGILLSGATATEINDRIPLKKLGEATVKGKIQAVEVYTPILLTPQERQEPVLTSTPLPAADQN
ncbi:adenylate/guanylate cyclase domain-containing protein [Parachitinimonas caeni]|uniref:Adenylate/guanylate cyclase domain-containing protein n=1 Tax=Parachitinimonas caeni TaxID=3031301 RepID=A0ABT7DZ21_9NEIS|nr:adenylate/guanylate cyclase domain-containing protein [Parachitinimonas caeni]MDK2125316.1 adenylate/guanylate cyclase domain-containing protein [Parachitinimonas caeni]